MFLYYYIKIGDFTGFIQIDVSDKYETTEFNMVRLNANGAKTVELFDDEIAILGGPGQDILIKCLMEAVFNKECEKFGLISGEEENLARVIFIKGFNTAREKSEQFKSEMEECHEKLLDELCDDEFGPLDENTLDP